jgi:cation/acetate symporter
MTARLTLIATGLLVIGSLTGSAAIDPLRLILWAFSISGATFFAVLVLSIWWHRLSKAGAAAGMIAGFFVSAGYIAASGEGGPPLPGVDSLTASAVGIPASFAAAVLVSILLPSRDPVSLERLEELRIPAGETLHVRAQRVGLRGKATAR